MLPATAQLWRWLAEVPDPEIPVLSVVDLGIVRDVAWVDRDGECVVTVTPTYSGCPATEVIRQQIVESLRAHGVENPKVHLQLSPAWTTDWMTSEARDKLRGYGIAPPIRPAGSAEHVVDISRLRRTASAPTVPCPRCGSAHTELVSQFGSTPCKSLYRCTDCREPFDHFKRH